MVNRPSRIARRGGDQPAGVPRALGAGARSQSSSIPARVNTRETRVAVTRIGGAASRGPRRICMQRVFTGVIATTLLAATGLTVHGSSHREALAILNEPCADNTDTYAWVSNASHDKLYLIMDFNPLHEPGQGNQGLR